MSLIIETQTTTTTRRTCRPVILTPEQFGTIIGIVIQSLGSQTVDGDGNPFTLTPEMVAGITVKPTQVQGMDETGEHTVFNPAFAVEIEMTQPAS